MRLRRPMPQAPAQMSGPQQGMTQSQMRNAAQLGKPQVAPPSMMSGLGATGMGARAAMGMKKGGKVSSASKRADGCAIKGKTKGRIV